MDLPSPSSVVLGGLSVGLDLQLFVVLPALLGTDCDVALACFYAAFSASSALSQRMSMSKLHKFHSLHSLELQASSAEDSSLSVVLVAIHLRRVTVIQLKGCEPLAVISRGGITAVASGQIVN